MQPLRDDRISGASLRCCLCLAIPSSQNTVRIILQDHTRSRSDNTRHRSFWIILKLHAAGLSWLVSRAAKLCRVPFSLGFSCAAAHLGRH